MSHAEEEEGAITFNHAPIEYTGKEGKDGRVRKTEFYLQVEEEEVHSTPLGHLTHSSFIILVLDTYKEADQFQT